MKLSEIESRIASMGELMDIVGAMRSLASMRVQEAHQAIPGVRRYADSMASAIGSALLLMPESPGGGRPARDHRVLVLCTAEHGFVGGFNERLLDAAAAGLASDDMLFILGTRGAVLAQERGYSSGWTSPMATRLGGVPETVRRLTADLYRTIARGAVTRAEVMFARYRQGSAPSIERRILFPIDLRSFAADRLAFPPLHNLPPDILLEKLIAEYVAALLIEAVTESLASENAARFTAMESARDNVSNKLDQLRADARQARQSEITTELIDLVTGAEAMKGGMAGTT